MCFLTHPRDLDERRKLMLELGPAYRPLMGTPMGRYELDMAKPMHQLAAKKVPCFHVSYTYTKYNGPHLGQTIPSCSFPLDDGDMSRQRYSRLRMI